MANVSDHQLANRDVIAEYGRASLAQPFGDRSIIIESALGGVMLPEVNISTVQGDDSLA
jgi:hypothetical protein